VVVLYLHFGPFNARCIYFNQGIGLINLELKIHQTFMNIAQFLILIKGWILGGNLAKSSHTNICNETHLISFQGEWRRSQVGPSSWSDHTKDKKINFYFIHLIFSFHCVSILIHHSFLEDYFVWHLYMFI
jgi:hypothetical protein